MSDLWTIASADQEGEAHLERLTAARLAVTPLWSFLASADSPEDYANRRALAAAQIEAAVQTVLAGDASTYIATLAALDEQLVDDYVTLYEARRAEKEAVAKEAGGNDYHKGPVTVKYPPESGTGGKFEVSCKNCGKVGSYDQEHVAVQKADAHSAKHSKTSSRDKDFDVLASLFTADSDAGKPPWLRGDDDDKSDSDDDDKGDDKDSSSDDDDSDKDDSDDDKDDDDSDKDSSDDDKDSSDDDDSKSDDDDDSDDDDSDDDDSDDDDDKKRDFKEGKRAGHALAKANAPLPVRQLRTLGSYGQGLLRGFQAAKGTLPKVVSSTSTESGSRKSAEKYQTPPGIDNPHGGPSYDYADPDDAHAVQSRFDSNAPVVKHPTDPSKLIFHPGNFWDGPTHVTKHSPTHYSFQGADYPAIHHFDHMGRTTDENGTLKRPEIYHPQTGKMLPYDQWPAEHSDNPFEGSRSPLTHEGAYLNPATVPPAADVEKHLRLDHGWLNLTGKGAEWQHNNDHMTGQANHYHDPSQAPHPRPMDTVDEDHDFEDTNDREPDPADEWDRYQEHHWGSKIAAEKSRAYETDWNPWGIHCRDCKGPNNLCPSCHRQVEAERDAEAKQTHSVKQAAENPFEPNSANPFVPSPGNTGPNSNQPDEEAEMGMPVEPMTTRPRQKPADNPGLKTPAFPSIQVQPQQAPVGSGISQGFASKAREIALEVRKTNPGVSPREALRLATATLRRFPSMMKHAETIAATNQHGYPDPRDYDPSDDYPETRECPYCAGRGEELGQLGQRTHYRCRDCGSDFSEHEADNADASHDDRAGEKRAARDQVDECVHCGQAINRGEGQGNRAWHHVATDDGLCADKQNVADPKGRKHSALSNDKHWCPKCGHTEDNYKNKCPSCGSKMRPVSGIKPKKKTAAQTECPQCHEAASYDTEVGVCANCGYQGEATGTEHGPGSESYDPRISG